MLNFIKSLFKKKKVVELKNPSPRDQCSSPCILSDKDIALRELKELFDNIDVLDSVLIDKMIEIRNICPQANGYCITELFCTECPFGLGKPVTTAKSKFN